jgi:hypothetical protein
MKTAVEWLVEQLSKKTKDLKMELHVHCGEIIDQAKEMEKEQIVKAHTNGWNKGLENNFISSQEYYNENYKSE